MDDDWIGAASAADLRRAGLEGRLTVTRIAESTLARIEAANPSVNAVVHLDADQVMADADRLDRTRSEGREPGALFGVPYTLKLLTPLAGSPGHLGFAPLVGRTHTTDSVVARRLRAADGLLLGITNAPPAGFYGGTDNAVYGPTRNPWNLDHTPGGSSGGAAAAVASGMVPVAEAGDGAGSVRIPAAMCGVVGFKPSTGRIPQELTDGRFKAHVAHGPITRTVADAAMMLDVLVGDSAVDPLSLPHDGRSYLDGLDDGIEGWRIAYSADLGLGPVEPAVAEVCRSAVDALKRAGADVVEATPDLGDVQRAMWTGVWLPDYAGLIDLLDWDIEQPTVDRRLQDMVRTGTRLTGEDIARADAVRAAAYRQYISFMADVDLLVSPTLGAASFPLTQFAPTWLEGKPLHEQILGWLLTYPANLFGVPAISVPAGTTADGSPVGIQFMGGFREDRRVLRAAAAFERTQPWPLIAPMEGRATR